MTKLLDRLLEGSPLGRTRDAAPGAPADRPVPQLIAIGLLRRVDADTVILPRHVGQVMRGEQPGPVRLAAPLRFQIEPVYRTSQPPETQNLLQPQADKAEAPSVRAYPTWADNNVTWETGL